MSVLLKVKVFVMLSVPTHKRPNNPEKALETPCGYHLEAHGT